MSARWDEPPGGKVPPLTENMPDWCIGLLVLLVAVGAFLIAQVLL